MEDRQIIRVTGPDCRDFLQGLITNDVEKLSHGLVYTALLNPQGKFLADFFLVPTDDGILIDVAKSHGEMLLSRLSMYRLRAQVDLKSVDIAVACGVGEIPDGAHQDPRHPDLGWRAYGTDLPDEMTDWDARCVAYCIPKTGVELTADTYILEAGFEKINGVDFKKGCYVGQEVTARMKHKTELKKGLTVVNITGTVPIGSDIVANDKTVGKVFTQANGKAIAYLRFDRATNNMRALDAEIQWTSQN